MADSSPWANCSSAALTATVIVIGFNNLVFIVRSNTFSVASNDSGKTGISNDDRVRYLNCVVASTDPVRTETTTSPSSATNLAGCSGPNITTSSSGVFDVGSKPVAKSAPITPAPAMRIRMRTNGHLRSGRGSLSIWRSEIGPALSIVNCSVPGLPVNPRAGR